MTQNQRASEWVDLYGDLLYNYAYHRVNDEFIAQDLVQDTLLSAFQSLDSFREEASDKTWLMRILKNKIIDHYRKTRTPRGRFEEVSFKREVSLNEFFDQDGEWHMSQGPRSWDTQADSLIENNQLKEALNACLSLLRGLGASAFQMKYLEEIPSDEICKELEITSSNYWVLIHRAKLQLRACLDKSYFQESAKSTL